MKKSSICLLLISFIFVSTVFVSCDESSDAVQREQQEKILAEGTSAVGMPAIKNFREKRILKDIIELRDQNGLITYTYIFSEMTGKYTYIGETIGYGIPCATQFTNPVKVTGSMDHRAVINQADPNGLFSPASAEGTWVMMLNTDKKTAEPQYIESRISVFTYKLRPSLVIAGY
ncbi:MAG: hypothetical protein WCN88_03730 [Candidatus Falkowbacteria bacterium]